MSMYKEGDHVIVDSHTGAERVVCTISEVLLVDEPIQKGINPLGTGPRLRYRAGSRIIRPEEIHGRAFNRPKIYGGMREQPSVSSTGGAKNVKPDSDEPDPVNHPEHYTSDPSGIECIEITRHRNFNIGNAIKYLWRAGLKDDTKQIEDLKKAAWYINDEINRLEQI